MRPTTTLSLARTLGLRNTASSSYAAVSSESAATASASSKTASSDPNLPSPFTAAHRSYVKSLYKRILKNELDWLVRRDLWRNRAIEVRAEFERNRDIRNPREVARVLGEAERLLAKTLHPDPYKSPMMEDGTKWERNVPPRIFTDAEQKAFHDSCKDILWDNPPARD